MDVIVTKGPVEDGLEIRRDGHPVFHGRFPKKGPVPHDAVHFIVEDSLGLARGFWGMVAQGHDPDQVQDIAKAAGHASAKRAEQPGAHIVELLQAERIVEAAEAALWSGGTDIDGMRHLAEAGCAASHVPMPDLSRDTLDALLGRLRALHDDWVCAPDGFVFSFRWVGI